MTRRFLIAIPIAVGIVAVDAVSKQWASVRFAAGPVEIIPGFLGFTFVENPGAALSTFQNAGPFLGVAAIAVTAAVLWALRRDRPILEVVALGLVMGGAMGNLIDRAVRGAAFLDGRVVDWINLWWIPTFNVADMSITFAVGLLLVEAWRTRSTS